MENPVIHESTPSAPLQKTKNSIDISKLIADSHLNKEERNNITELYSQNKDALIAATKGNLKFFITNDYGAANMQALGGTQGLSELQTKLNIGGSLAERNFGPDTFLAILKYQKDNGLSVDGIAGPETQKSLGMTQINQSTKKDLITNKWGVSEDKAAEYAAEDKESIEVDNIIHRYKGYLQGIEDSMNALQNDRDTNTGIFNIIVDNFIETSHGISGRDIYDNNLRGLSKIAIGLISKFKDELVGKKQTKAQIRDIVRIESDLEECSERCLPRLETSTAIKNTKDFIAGNIKDNNAFIGETLKKIIN